MATPMLKHSKSSKAKLQNIRSKLQSLTLIKKLNIQDLSKQLIKQNKIEDPQTKSQNQYIYEQRDDEIKIEEKLWKYFKQKCEDNVEKVQKEKVNHWKKLLKKIVEEAQKRLKLNQKNKESIECSIKSKYKEIHMLHREIDQIKGEKKREQSQRKKKNSIQIDRTDKLVMIYQNIGSLKQEIQERNTQMQCISKQIGKIKLEIIKLLTNFLSHGFYLQDGCLTVFTKLFIFGYQLQLADLPSFLDQRSKQYLMYQYNYIKSSKANDQQFNAKGNSSRVRAQSNIQLSNLVKHEHFRDIYNNTRQYLNQLLLKEHWKQEKTTKLPKIYERNQIDSIQRLRQSEKKRIKLAYPEQKRQLVKKIQFGVKLETVFL